MDEAYAVLYEVIRELEPKPPQYDPSVKFHIGFSPSHRFETARQKHDRLRAQQRKKAEAQRKQRRHLRMQQSGPPVRHRQWRLLPKNKCPSEASAFCVDLLHGNTYCQKKKSLESIGIMKNHSKLQPPPSMATFKQDIKKIKADAAIILDQNQKLIWIFRKVLHVWRGRHQRLCNQEDPITLTAPIKPVMLRNFTQRSIYQFDAVALARTFHLKLLHHDGPFPYPLAPRNPLTNELLTLSQLLSVFQQIQNHGVSYWTLDAFRRAGCCVLRFAKAHDKALKLHALKSILWDMKDPDGMDSVFDFMEAQHDYHGQTLYKNLYVWFLHNKPEDPILLTWRRLCQAWHETDILEGEGQPKENAYDRIYEKTAALCEKPTELLVKRRLLITQNRA